MKYVALIAISFFIHAGAWAQAVPIIKAGKASVTKIAHSKKQSSKVKAKKIIFSKSDDVTVLSDEKSYKAKSRFELMLMRRMEIDSELAENRD